MAKVVTVVTVVVAVLVVVATAMVMVMAVLGLLLRQTSSSCTVQFDRVHSQTKLPQHHASTAAQPETSMQLDLREWTG